MTLAPPSISALSSAAPSLSSTSAIIYNQVSYIIKKLRTAAEFFDLLSALDLSGTKATGANGNGTVGSVNYCLDLADVRLPGSVGLTVRVGNVMSEGNALTANATLSHFDTS